MYYYISSPHIFVHAYTALLPSWTTGGICDYMITWRVSRSLGEIFQTFVLLSLSWLMCVCLMRKSSLRIQACRGKMNANINAACSLGSIYSLSTPWEHTHGEMRHTFPQAHTGCDFWESKKLKRKSETMRERETCYSHKKRRDMGVCVGVFFPGFLVLWWET